MYIADIPIQVKNITAGCGLGFFLGIAYQIIKTMYLVFPKSKILLFCADFIFVLISAISVFVLLVAIDNGYLRLYIILSVLIGFTVCAFTAGEQIFFINSCILRVVKKILSVIFKPFVKILKKLLKSSEKIKNKLKKLLKHNTKVLYNIKE